MKKIKDIARKAKFYLQAFKELKLNPGACVKFARLHASKNITVQEYYKYKSWLEDPVFKESFLSYKEAQAYWKILNPIKYAVIARDKYITHLVLERVNIPMPKLYAYYNCEAGISYEDVFEQLSKNHVKQCVIKPAADGAHGSGVFICKEIVYNESDCIIEKTNGETLSLKHLLDVNKCCPLLFEEKIDQTQQINSINSSSVNTVRFMTALYPGKDVKVFATFLKIGREGSDVDNAGGGGNIDCGINTDSGQCYNTMQFNSFNDITHVTRHPDTGTMIENIVMDNWSEVVKEVKGFQAKIPYLKTIGWDIALTNNGPVVIEINNWWDTTGQVFIGKGWRDEVRECYIAWRDYYQNKEK
ncbi:MAG: hypothetical protein IKZ56_05415 [Bacteroidales bacterium]|nr:hypothetical protein [Bacteroidales bacterium]